MWKRDLPRTKFLYQNSPHHPLYLILQPKKQKTLFTTQKSLKVLNLLRVHSGRVLFRVLSDSVVFRFLSDWVFFRFLFLLALSDRVLFESSVIGSSKGSSVIDSSLGYQSYFSSMPVLFYQKVLPLFYWKQMFCFTLYFQKEVHT